MSRGGRHRGQTGHRWPVLHLQSGMVRISCVQRAVVLAVTLSVLVAVLTGCSSSSNPESAAKATTTEAKAATSTTSTALALPPTGTSTSTPIPPHSPQCTATDLRPSWPGIGDGASGVLYFTVNLLNSSQVTCATGGYVGVSAYEPSGVLIAASDSREPLGSANPPPTLAVDPGQSVHFIVGLPDVNQAEGGAECSTTVGALHLIPPNERTELQIATPVHSTYPSLCEGTIYVGPLQSGALNL